MASSDCFLLNEIGVTWRCDINAPHTLMLHEEFDSPLTLSNITIMVNEKIIQKFISDLGTITCSEAYAINYFHSFGFDPKEYMAALNKVPGIHIVNNKVWYSE